MKIAVPIISLLLCACTVATYPDYKLNTTELLPGGSVSIGMLKSSAQSQPVPVVGDIVIHGQVVANDLFGEFSREIVVIDGSGGIGISLNRLRLNTVIPLNAEVEVSCNGLWLRRSGGQVRLCGDDGSGIAASQIGRHIAITRIGETPQPLELTVAELSEEHIQRFVCIRSLRIADDERGSAWCDLLPGEEAEQTNRYTDRHFTDAEGSILCVRSLNSCDYRNEPIPDTELALAGIVEYNDGQYMLRIVNRSILTAQY